MFFKIYPFTIYSIPHLDKVPSHFSKVFILKPKNQKVTMYTVKSEYSMRRLLPWPFEHDCYNYDSPTSKFKSREYCYLDVMKKLEFKYCKVNKYWTVDTDFNKNITQCIKPNFTLLNILCKINCLDILTDYLIFKNDAKMKELKNIHVISIQYDDNIKQRLHLEYSPRFTIVQLFSTMGGLLGMWLGLSIYNLFLKFFEFIYKIYLKLKIRLSILYLMKIHPYFIIIIILFMTLNLREIFNEFLSGHTITKISIVKVADWPDVMINPFFASINKQCDYYFEFLMKNYSNIENIINQNYPNLRNLDKNPSLLDTFQQVFIKEIILEYGYEYFIEQIFPKYSPISSCTIEDHNDNLIDCKKFIKIHVNNKLKFTTYYKFGKITLQDKINRSDFKKITIKLNVEKCVMKKVSLTENNLAKYYFSVNEGTIITMKYQKVMLRRSSLSDRCIQNQSYNINDCGIKFMNNLLINNFKFDCMPRDRIEFYIDDFELFGNKFCHRDKLLKPYLSEIITKSLADNCPLPCENELVSADVSQKPHPSKIKIIMIPKYNLKPIFSYSLSMDYNNLIYDLGGTIGMWIGWSALTIPIYIYEIIKKLNYQIIRYHLLNKFNIIFNWFKLFLTKLILFLKFFIKLFKWMKTIINISKIKLTLKYNYFKIIMKNYSEQGQRNKIFPGS